MILVKLLITAFVTYLCSILHIVCFKTLSSGKIIKNKKTLICFLILSVLILLVNFYANPTFNTLTSFLLTLLLYQLLFGFKISKTLFYAFAIWVMGMLLDFIVVCVLTLFGIKNLNQLGNSVLWLKLSISALIPIIIYFLFKIKKVASFINNLYEKTKIEKINYQVLIILLVIGINFLAVINSFIVNKIILKYLIIIVLIIFCIMLCIIIFLNYRKNVIKLENLRLIENNGNYHAISKEYRLLRHNLINRLMGIKSVANKRSKELIENLIYQYRQENEFINIIDSAPTGINGIIYQKMYPYANTNIYFIINSMINEKSFQKLKAWRYNLLCETIGLVLDNALEALEESTKKILYIDIKEEKDKIEILIANTFQNDIDLEKLGEENYSTKKRKSGIGLNYLLNNKNLNFKTVITNNVFFIKFSI